MTEDYVKHGQEILQNLSLAAKGLKELTGMVAEVSGAVLEAESCLQQKALRQAAGDLLGSDADSKKDDVFEAVQQLTRAWAGVKGSVKAELLSVVEEAVENAFVLSLKLMACKDTTAKELDNLASAAGTWARVFEATHPQQEKRKPKRKRRAPSVENCRLVVS